MLKLPHVSRDLHYVCCQGNKEDARGVQATCHDLVGRFKSLCYTGLNMLTSRRFQIRKTTCLNYNFMFILFVWTPTISWSVEEEQQPPTAAVHS
jgi:hypothetical protein